LYRRIPLEFYAMDARYKGNEQSDIPEEDDSSWLSTSKEECLEFNELLSVTSNRQAGHRSPSPKYSPTIAASSLDSPAYSVASFWFGSDTPNYYSMPDYGDYSTSPSYFSITSPLYTPETPSYSPTSPSINSVTSTYGLTSPLYCPDLPNYSPTVTSDKRPELVGSLMYCPTSPTYLPSLPNYPRMDNLSDRSNKMVAGLSENTNTIKPLVKSIRHRRRTIFRCASYQLVLTWKAFKQKEILPNWNGFVVVKRSNVKKRSKQSDSTESIPPLFSRII
jgi:hypothetical protein